MDSTINLYVAIDEMRSLSKKGVPFSLSFRKWDRYRGQGGDLALISHAILRPAARGEDVSNAEYKLFFTDRDTGQARVCWRILVTEFNGQKVVFEGK